MKKTVAVAAWLVVAAFAHTADLRAIHSLMLDPLTVIKNQAKTGSGLQPRFALRNVQIPALHWAAIEGDAAEVKRLIAQGANVNATETLWGGERALHWAAAGRLPGSASAVRALIAAGAEIDARDDQGETAVREALRPVDSHFLALTALLAAGADPEARSDNGLSALHEAVIVKVDWELGAVVLLRMFGANPNSALDNGATPLHLASGQLYERFTGELLATTSWAPRGQITSIANLNATDNDGNTPLHWLVSKEWSARDRRVLNWFIRQGANINPTNDWGSTPLDLAVFSGHDELAGALRWAGGVERRSPPILPILP